MIPSRLVPLLAGAALIAGCTVGPTYRPLEAGVPAAFAGPQPSSAQVDPATWWRAFGDPMLDRLVEQAVKDNPDIAIAASRIRQARIQEIVARAGGKPTVNATANVSHVEFSRNAGFASLARAFSGGGNAGTTGGIALPGSGITTYAPGFDAAWELDLFGGNRRSVEAARARTGSAEWTARDAAVTLAAEVAQGYFALRLDQVQIGVIEQELIRQRRAQQISANIATAGLVPPIDVVRQRGSVTTLEARLEPVRADIAVRMHALAILLGQPPAALMSDLSRPVPATTRIPTLPAGLPSDLLRRRPDIRAAERDLAASTADIGVAVADLYPRFTLTGIAQLISTTLSTLFAGNSLQLTGTGAASFPLVDWGRRKATVKIREEARDQAYATYRATVLRALRDVEDALVLIDAERRRNDTLKRAVADTETSARSAEAQYRAGFVTQAMVLNAQIDVLSVREQIATSDARLRQASASLFKAVGGGWEGSPPLQRVSD